MFGIPVLKVTGPCSSARRPPSSFIGSTLGLGGLGALCGKGLSFPVSNNYYIDKCIVFICPEIRGISSAFSQYFHGWKSRFFLFFFQRLFTRFSGGTS